MHFLHWVCTILLRLRPTFLIDFAIMSIQMLYSVYCQLSHSLAVVWAVTLPVAIALCEKQLLQHQVYLEVLPSNVQSTHKWVNTHTLSQTYTLFTSNGPSTKIDHIAQKCAILLSTEYQLCSVVHVHPFNISVYLLFISTVSIIYVLHYYI